MAEKKKTTGAAGSKASGTKKPATGKKPAAKPAPKAAPKAPKKDERTTGSKPAAKKPTSGKQPAGTGKPAGKPSGKPAAKKPAAGKKPVGAAKPGSKPAGKPFGKPAAKKPAAGGKKSSGPAKPQTHAERRREEKAMAEPRAAKPRPATPRKAEGGAPKRLPKEAVLAGVQPQPKPVKRPGAKKAQRPDPAGVRATMRQVATWLHAKKALDIVALDVAGLCSVAEGLVLATARNVRQAQALADHVLKTAGESGISYLGMEGYRAGSWVLLDLNDVLVHVFQEDTRRFYNLEGLWADAKPVKLDLGPSEEAGDE